MERDCPKPPTSSCPDRGYRTPSPGSTTQLPQNPPQARDSITIDPEHLGCPNNGEMSDFRIVGFKRADGSVDPIQVRMSDGEIHYQIEWVDCLEPEADAIHTLPASRIFTQPSTDSDAILPLGLTLDPLEVEQRAKVWALLLPPVAQDTQENWAIAVSNIDELDWTIWEIVKTSFGGYKIEAATSKLAPPTANGKTPTYLGEVAQLDAIQMVKAIPWEIRENPILWTRRAVIIETWYALYEDDALNLAEYEFGKGELTKTIVLP